MFSRRTSLLAFLALLAFPAPGGGLVAADGPAPAFDELTRLDFSALKRELERAGWPAVHVQAFLNAEIQRRICPPDALTAADFRPFEFWRTGPDAEPLAHLNTPERQAARARREEEARTTFDTLFPPTEQDADRLLLAWEERRRWGDLPEEKRQVVATVLANAEKQRSALLNSRGGMLTADERKQVRAFANQARAELAALLTAEELLDHDLRNSATANRMRAELDNFQPTQNEFLAIFRLRHELELAFDQGAPGHDEELEQRRAEAAAATDQAIAKLLGPERYDDYRLSLQPACQTLQFDGRHARADAVDVRRLYRELLAAQAGLRATETLPEPERLARADELKQALHRSFRLVLDEEGARRYLQEQELWP